MAARAADAAGVSFVLLFGAENFAPMLLAGGVGQRRMREAVLVVAMSVAMSMRGMLLVRCMGGEGSVIAKCHGRGRESLEGKSGHEEPCDDEADD